MIEILNKNYRKIDILRAYTFAQYRFEFRGLGEFTIYATLCDENLYLLKDEQYYVLFDNKIFGVVERAKKKAQNDSDYSDSIILTGKLANVIFQNTVNSGTITVSGRTYQLVAEFIKQRILAKNVTNGIPRFSLDYDEMILQDICSNVSTQMTGETVYDCILPSLEQDALGVVIETKTRPVELEIYDENSNIEEFAITIKAGRDLTRTNTKGNSPVIFSQSLSNIFRTGYDLNKEEYANVAYVAGEGGGDERRWFRKVRDGATVNDNLYGTKELWVDARDIQSEDEEGETIPDEEYSKLIDERADEKFSENNVAVEYTATINTESEQYKFGVDYDLGDFCTVADTELNVEQDAQITAVIISKDGGNAKEVIDIELTYGVSTKSFKQQVQSGLQSIESNEANIKYLNNTKKVRSLAVILDNEYEGIPTDYLGNYTGKLDVSTRVQVYYGQTEVTNSCAFTTQTSNGVTGSWSSINKMYTITDLATDMGWVDITATYLAGMKVTKRFNVTKVKGGIPGTSGTQGTQGINILLNSKNLKGKTGSYVDDDGFTVGYTTGVNNQWAEIRYPLTVSAVGNQLTGQMVTISLEFKTNDIMNIANMIFGLGTENSEGARVDDLNLAVSDYTVIRGELKNDTWCTIKLSRAVPTTWTSSTAVTYVLQVKSRNILPTNVTFYYKKMKVEVGEVAYPVWTPAIEDLQGENGTNYSNNILRGTNIVTELTTGIWADSAWRSSSSGTGERVSINVSDCPNPSITTGWRISSTSGNIDVAQRDVPLNSADTYTMSCYARVISGSPNLYLRSYDLVSGVTLVALNQKISNTEWVRYAGSFKFDGNTVEKVQVQFGVYNGTGTLEICGMKLELGEVKAEDTVWNPAIEDLQGADGVGVKSTAITYQASTNGTTAPTGTWSTTIPTVAAGSYLWTRTVITYTNDTSSTSYSVSKTGTNGKDGDNGKGISSITNYYLATSAGSGVTTSTSGWTTTVQTMTTTNKYLWNYEVIAYTDGTSTTVAPHIIGVYGSTGSAGKGISSIVEYYALSSNTTAPADSAFSTTVPTMTATNKYLWNYEKITYTDNTSENTTKHIIGAYGNTGAQGESGTKINLLKSDWLDLYSGASGTLEKNNYTKDGSFKYTRGAASNMGFYVDNKELMEVSTTYVVSFEARLVSGTITYLYPYTSFGDNANSECLIDGVSKGKLNQNCTVNMADGEWHKFVIRYTTGSSITGGNYVGHIMQFQKTDAVAFSVECRYMKWEKGDNPTEWTPAINDLRGTGILKVTTAPTAYTTAVGGITPAFRMDLATVKTQAGVGEVLVGDVIEYSYNHYTILYIDGTYAYIGAATSIRGATGAAGRTYFVELSANVLKRGANNAITPATITANAYYRDGSSATRTAYSGRWIVATSTNGTSWTNVVTSTANETSKSYSVDSLATNIVAVRFTLYAAGGTTTALDMQSATIVVDVANLTHADIFNLLTNNGKIQGIYEENGQIYVSAEYIQSGAFVVRDKNNQVLFSADKDTRVVQIGGFNVQDYSLIASGTNGDIVMTGGSGQQRMHLTESTLEFTDKYGTNVLIDSSDKGIRVGDVWYGLTSLNGIGDGTVTGAISASNTNKVLLTCASYMNAGQTYTLSEPISAQSKGIVVVWSRYLNGEAVDQYVSCHFIPKEVVASMPNATHEFSVGISNLIGRKVLQITDTKVTGNAINSGAQTLNGYSVDMNNWVLRYIIGV